MGISAYFGAFAMLSTWFQWSFSPPPRRYCEFPLQIISPKLIYCFNPFRLQDGQERADLSHLIRWPRVIVVSLGADKIVESKLFHKSLGTDLYWSFENLHPLTRTTTVYTIRLQESRKEMPTLTGLSLVKWQKENGAIPVWKLKLKLDHPWENGGAGSTFDPSSEQRVSLEKKTRIDRLRALFKIHF